MIAHSSTRCAARASAAPWSPSSRTSRWCARRASRRCPTSSPRSRSAPPVSGAAGGSVRLPPRHHRSVVPRLLLHADLPDHRDHRRRRQLLGRDRSPASLLAVAAGGAALLRRLPHDHLRRDPGRRRCSPCRPASPAGSASAQVARMRASASMKAAPMTRAPHRDRPAQGLCRRASRSTASRSRSQAGSITGLIGPNGSGKSTAIDCIAGFQKLDGGKVALDGSDITGMPPHHIARAGLMRTFQTVRIYERLSLVATTRASPRSSSTARPGSTSSSARGAIATRSTASEVARQRAGRPDRPAQISTRSRPASCPTARRSWWRSPPRLMPHPKIVVLDEPVAGVNPSRIREIEVRAAAAQPRPARPS